MAIGNLLLFDPREKETKNVGFPYLSTPFVSVANLFYKNKDCWPKMLSTDRRLCDFCPYLRLLT